jgi:hypothetical protein
MRETCGQSKCWYCCRHRTFILCLLSFSSTSAMNKASLFLFLLLLLVCLPWFAESGGGECRRILGKWHCPPRRRHQAGPPIVTEGSIQVGVYPQGRRSPLQQLLPHTRIAPRTAAPPPAGS